MASPTYSDTPDSSRAPGVNLFRRNAFRLLGVAVYHSTQEAVWKGEKLLALYRSGLPPTPPPLVPWLAATDGLDLQEAMQRMEEPLHRLVDELLWFDFPEDALGPQLEQALAEGSAEQLVAYIKAVEQKLSKDKSEPAESDQPAAEALRAVAHARNQANLFVLLGFAGLHELLPAVDSEPLPAGLVQSAAPYEWRREGELEFLDSPHRTTAGLGGFSARHRAWIELLPLGFRRWRLLADHPRFADYVAQAVARLDDDLLGPDDYETIGKAVNSRLCDTVIGELQLLLARGHDEAAALLLQCAPSDSDSQPAWALATRSLRPFFQAELDELDSLLPKTEAANLEHLGQLLTRLQRLRQRWQRLDPASRLGLYELVDQKLRLVLDAVQGSHGIGKALQQRKSLIEQALTLTEQRSLQERMRSYMQQQDGYTEKYACYYCGIRDCSSEEPVVISYKRLTGMTPMFNGITYHYSIKYGLVPRCRRCAMLHDFQLLHRFDLSVCFALGSVPMFALFVALLAWLYGNDVDKNLEEMWQQFSWLGAVAMVSVGAVIGLSVNLLLQPAGERPRNDVENSPTARKLRDDGFHELEKIDCRTSAFRELVANQ